MVLTTPFINTIPAFDANVGITLNVNILGGDAITGYQFLLLENTGTENPFYTSNIISVANDIAGASIRSYPITIPANASGTNELGQNISLKNNSQYRIQAKTYNANGESILGNDALFTCYTTPTTILQVLQSQAVVAEYEDVSDGSLIPASKPAMKLVFKPNDLQSIAEPNILVANVYGIKNGNKHYISTSGEVYDFKYDITNNVETYSAEFQLSGFSINVNIDEQGNVTPRSGSLYDDYVIEYSVRTIENMVLTDTFEHLNCYYTAIQNSPFLEVNNICEKGVINLTCSVTSFNGTSNPSPPTYINDAEVDLTATGAWAKWENLFSLNQPYTLSIWGRNFNNGTIVKMTTSGVVYKYIKLAYNTVTQAGIEYSFISLESGRNDNYGKTMFPYYIESEYIEKSLITENTNLFIGIQQQDDLFDIHFEKIS